MKLYGKKLDKRRWKLLAGLLHGFGQVQCMGDSRKAKQALHWVEKTEVDHALPGKTPSGETMNRWTKLVSRQWTELTDWTVQ